MTNFSHELKEHDEADLHRVLDQKEKQNPIRLLNQYLRQCEQETEKVRALVERQYSFKGPIYKRVSACTRAG